MTGLGTSPNPYMGATADNFQSMALKDYWGEQSLLQQTLDQIATNTGSGGYESGRTPGGGRPVKTNTGSGYKGMDFTSTDPADYSGWVGITGGY